MQLEAPLSVAPGNPLVSLSIAVNVLVVAVAGPIAALVTVVILGTVFGAF